ncbi:hypothetical protein NN561_019721 [Cricetulus griseus]
MADPPQQHPRGWVVRPLIPASWIPRFPVLRLLASVSPAEASSEGKLFVRLAAWTISGHGTSSLGQSSRVNAARPGRLPGFSKLSPGNAP